MKTPQRSGLYVALVLAGLLSAKAEAASATASRSAISAGQKAFVFHVKAMDGKMINFPDDYRGKVVLLDFWATWCGPCRAEIPKVVAAYNDYHSKGFEVVSVSLDQPQQGPAVLKFAKDNNMAWPQIYDGQFWKAAVAARYGVRSIPCPVLVDGDTGLVLATDRDALGSRLTKALETALAGKSRKPQ